MEYLKICLAPVNPDAANEIEALWSEYEKGETDIAKWVHDIDVLERSHQAMIYEERDGQAEKFEVFREELEVKIKHPKMQPWAECLLQEWAVRRSRRDTNIVIIFVYG